MVFSSIVTRSGCYTLCNNAVFIFSRRGVLIFFLLAYSKERGHSIVLEVGDKEMLQYMLDNSRVIIEAFGSFPSDVT
jgi:hypothetical protein